MKLDEIVLRRFDELLAKAEAIRSRRSYVERSRDAYYVPEDEVVGWGTSAHSLLERVLSADSAHCRHFAELFKPGINWYEHSFQKLIAIVAAAKEDYIGGYLFSVRGLVKAEVFADASEQAQELLDAGYKDAACIVIGVSLEGTIKELAHRRGIALEAKRGLEDANVKLCKAGVYTLIKQQQITAWAALRNKAAHGEWAAYKKEDVAAMLEGVRRFMGDAL